MSIEAGSGSPLAGLQQGGALLRHGNDEVAWLAEQPPIPLARLRMDSGHGAGMQAVAGVLGLDLPTVPNTVAVGEQATVWWTSPDEWFIQGRAGQADDLAERLGASVEGVFAQVTRQGSASSIVHLAGPAARDVLNGGCPLDLDPGVFRPGQCAQSIYFKTAIMLRPLADDGSQWELVFRRSFADYAVRMLMDAIDLLALEAVGAQVHRLRMLSAG